MTKNRQSSTPKGPTKVGLIVDRDKSLPKSIPEASATPETMQYELWSTFWSSEKGNLSNTVELWDAIPKFSVHRNKQLELRTSDGYLPMHRQSFVYQGGSYLLEIQPAVIREDNRDVSYYPSGDEELIWEALVKLFSDQQYGFHDTRENPPSSYVRFTLRMLQKELSQHGHSRSIPQIRHAIEVLARSMLIITPEGKKKPLYRDVALGGLIDMTRDDYLDDPKRFWLGRLPGMISLALASLEYRQYNYAISLRIKDPFARWLHRRMTHRYTNASLMNDYHLALSTMREESGLLEGDNITRIIKRVDACYAELRKQKVISGVDKDVQRATGRGRKITEVVWTARPMPNFVDDTKAANGRLREARAQLSLVRSRPENRR